jgi:hypothetical protein
MLVWLAVLGPNAAEAANCTTRAGLLLENALFTLAPFRHVKYTQKASLIKIQSQSYSPFLGGGFAAGYSSVQIYKPDAQGHLNGRASLRPERMQSNTKSFSA